MEESKGSYESILKSTFLFGSVQIVNIIVKVGINKVVAILLGTTGMGVIGLLQSTLSVLSTACGLGVSQSAVKDIAQGSATSPEEFSRSVSITKQLVLLLGVIGALITVILSPWLSECTFGDNQYTYHYIALSVAVFFTIVAEGYQAILKGARLLRLLAKASLLGSVVGLFTSVPLYFWLGKSGIVPSLIIAAVTAMLFSVYYVSKVQYEKYSFSIKATLKESRVMIRMGVALMYVSFLGVLSDYIIRAFISDNAGVATVGIFQAGAMIVTSYFGIVLTALTTDYYPRISAINQDNKALQAECNRQSEVGLLLVGILVIVFMFAMPLFIRILYTESFMPIISFLQYAIFGVIFFVCSNALGMILLAKQASGTFFYTATIGRIVMLSMSMVGFIYGGLTGLGVAAAAGGVFHLCFLFIIIYRKYKIMISKRLLFMHIVILIFAGCSFFVKEIDSLLLRCVTGSILFVIYIVYALRSAKNIMGIDIIGVIKDKISKR